MLFTENVISLTEAAKALPKIDGKRIHAASLWRWARKGVRGVKLDTRQLGGRLVTSLEALERFSKALSELPPQIPKRTFRPKLNRTERQRQRAIARSDAEAKTEGLD